MTTPKTITVPDAKRFALAAAVLGKRGKADSAFDYVWLEPFGGTFASNGYSLVVSLDTHEPFDGEAIGVRLDKRVAKNFHNIEFDLAAGIARCGNGKVFGMQVAAERTQLPQYGSILPDLLVTVITNEVGIGYRNLREVPDVIEWFGEAMPTFRFGRRQSNAPLHVLAADDLGIPAIVCSTPVTRSIGLTQSIARRTEHGLEVLAQLAETGGEYEVKELHYDRPEDETRPMGGSPLNIFMAQLGRWNTWRREQGLEAVDSWRGVKAPQPLPVPEVAAAPTTDDWFAQAVTK